MVVYALAIFTGAFLLFQVQPLIGKFILPWFGGGPGVWTTCLLFFQLLLLGGYTYAHLVTSRLRPRQQLVLHVLLLVAAVAFLPITPTESWKPKGDENPVLRILALLAVTLGLPYLLLSATGPLLQRWLGQIQAARSGAAVQSAEKSTSLYRLYALSNVGSLLALLSYPTVVEPHWTRKIQATFWSSGFVFYAVLCAWCAWRFAATAGKVTQSKEQPNTASVAPVHQPTVTQRALWFLLPACACILLMGVTNKVCVDVAVIPFLWVLPLALYLLSFIITFDRPQWYSRVVFTFLLIPALGAISWAMFHGTDVSIKKLVIIYCSALFIACMVCHGELYRLRPDPALLTSFYLAIAAGGAAGGCFVALAAPALFNGYQELHIGLFLCALLFFVACVRDRPVQAAGQWRGWVWLACILPFFAFAGMDWLLVHSDWARTSHPRVLVTAIRVGIWSVLILFAASWVGRRSYRTFTHWHLLTMLWLVLGLGALGTVLWRNATLSDPDIVERSRNFYGVLTVFEHQRSDPLGHYMLLQHGGTTHGIQFVDPDQATWATSYYGAESGIGMGMNALPKNARRVGVVGLGTGTLTVYGKTGDYFRIYEINPAIQRIATNRFTYVPHCPAVVEVIPGDARLSMERDLPQEFDLIALDAFSGDAIPVHLLTREAFALYDLNLRKDGIIAVHISNHYLDLEPVVAKAAREFGFKAAVVEFDESGEDWWLYASTWILLSHDKEVLDDPDIRQAARPIEDRLPRMPLWTDDFASLFPILK